MWLFFENEKQRWRKAWKRKNIAYNIDGYVFQTLRRQYQNAADDVERLNEVQEKLEYTEEELKNVKEERNDLKKELAATVRLLTDTVRFTNNAYILLK